MRVSLSDPWLWFIYLLEEPPAFCFDAPFAALEGGMIIVACSHWLTSFQMCAPDGYPENPPQTQISCLALTGWIQAETQSSAALSSFLAGSIHGVLQAKHSPSKTTLYLFLTHRKH